MTLKDSQYKELMRLYPKIRIPYLKEAAYYLWELNKTDSSIYTILDSFQDCFEKHGDVTSYKMKKMDEIIKYFKDDFGFLQFFNGRLLPSNEAMKSPYPKSFGNWKEGNIYVSVDMQAACWSVFQKIGGIMGEQSWEEYITEHFDAHPLIAKSKSFRQFVMGNLNPGRQQSFQKEFMIQLAEKYVTAGIPAPVSLSADELIFEFEFSDDYVLKTATTFANLGKLEYPIKIKCFNMEVHDNLGERVLVKNCEGKRELFSVQGTRYFMHYKNLILNKPIEDNDLYFEPEPKRLAKWVI